MITTYFEADFYRTYKKLKHRTQYNLNIPLSADVQPTVVYDVLEEEIHFYYSFIYSKFMDVINQYEFDALTQFTKQR